MSKRPPDLDERTHEFAGRITRLCQALEQKGDEGRKLSQQLRQPGTSIQDFVKKALASERHADYVAGLEAALEAARQTLQGLQAVVEASLFLGQRLEPIVAETDQIIQQLGATVRNALDSK